MAKRAYYYDTSHFMTLKNPTETYFHLCLCVFVCVGPYLSSTSWNTQLGVCVVVKMRLSGGILGAGSIEK